MFNRILLAAAGRPTDEQLILYAGHMARIEKATITVFHSYQLPTHYEGTAGYDALSEQMRAIAQNIVDELVSELREDGIDANGEVRAGDATETIIAAVAERECNLIVMGAHGGRLSDVLGSVSIQVARRSPCPIVLVP